MVHDIVKLVLYPLMRVLFVKEISGIENLPKKGPYIVVANHSSYIDGALLLLIFLWHKDVEVHFFMWKKLFESWFGRFVFWKWFDQIKENGSVERGLRYLGKGKIIGIFPEGGRTRNGRMKEVIHSGLGVLALASKAPVVPVGLGGTYELWPRTRKLPKLRRIVSIRIGKPLRFNLPMTKKNYNIVISKVMKEVARLANNSYPW
ncbi:MAG: lysophospholipid acyltransferase family protein [Candidatus Woesearchaeota archaeon]